MKAWSPFATGRKHRRLAWQDGLALLLLLAIVCWFWLRARELPAYGWQWPLLGDFLLLHTDSGWRPGLLLQGLATTLRVGLWTFTFSLIAGGAIGMAASRHKLWAFVPALALINLIRNTPPLVILFSIYFFAGNIIPVEPLENAIRHLSPPLRETIAWIVCPPGQMDRFLAAVLALGVYQGAYVAEIVRGGILSVPRGQWDASLALGFNHRQTLRLVILPQAMRLMLPPLTGQAISTLKDSALASLISLPDLTFQSLEIMAVSDMTFEIWLTSALIYLAIGAVCAGAGALLERSRRQASA